jgi:phosphate transport system permease protein
MTDLAQSQPSIRSAADGLDKARRLVRARHRADARFRLYGLAAILLTATFLVILLSSIVWKGMPAFYQHSVTLTVTPTVEQVAPDGKLDPQSLRLGDYLAPIRAALFQLFPDVTDRVGRRRLGSELLSSGAADALRDKIIADPSLLGRSITLPVLMSTQADEYLKGHVTGRSTRQGSAALTPSAMSGEITLSGSSLDFAAPLAEIKARLDEEAARVKAEGQRLTRLADTTAGAEREGLLAKGAAALAAAAALERRVAAPTGPEPLGDDVPSQLVAINGGVVKLTELRPDGAAGLVLSPLASTVVAGPGAWTLVTLEAPRSTRKLDDQVIVWIDRLVEKGLTQSHISTRFFTAGDSREPELAGLAGALVGSALTMLVTLVICVPLGVAAAIYLEMFAPKNWLTDLIEVNINNLAAVPSIVFGLLGLAVFLNFFGMPRSSAVVGGLVLALLVLPTIIIASRAALKAVPPSILEGALGVGASHQQGVFHFVLPLAMPGIMTGTIIGMAHALGETAPLLLIGMVAFIVDVPTSVTAAATALPVQIYLWSDLPEAGFVAKTSGAIIVLLLFLFVMNGAAILLRRSFERRW